MAQDLGLANAEAVNALADALNSEVEARLVERLTGNRAQRDGNAATKVEAQCWVIPGTESNGHEADRKQKDCAQRIDEFALHYFSVLSSAAEFSALALDGLPDEVADVSTFF